MRNLNATRARAQAKADPEASSQKATIARKRRADQRSVEARLMRRKGASVSQIMRALNVSRRTVYNLLKRKYDSPMPQKLL